MSKALAIHTVQIRRRTLGGELIERSARVVLGTPGLAAAGARGVSVRASGLDGVVLVDRRREVVPWLVEEEKAS